MVALHVDSLRLLRVQGSVRTHGSDGNTQATFSSRGSPKSHLTQLMFDGSGGTSHSPLPGTHDWRQRATSRAPGRLAAPNGPSGICCAWCHVN